MRLTEILSLISNGDVIKDGEFTSLGLAVSKCDEKLLTFIENEKYISSLG